MRLGLCQLADCWAGHGVRAHPVSSGLLEAVSAPHVVALARAGATVINGKLIEGPGGGAEPEAA
jgi:hypothetical protein